MFELTKSRQGLQEQNNMLLAAANLHTKLVRDNSKVISLSPNQRKKLIKDGLGLTNYMKIFTFILLIDLNKKMHQWEMFNYQC